MDTDGLQKLIQKSLEQELPQITNAIQYEHPEFLQFQSDQGGQHLRIEVMETKGGNKTVWTLEKYCYPAPGELVVDTSGEACRKNYD